MSPALSESDETLITSADYYSANVTLHFTGGEAPAYEGDGPQRTVGYLHERMLSGGGVWETRASYETFLPLGENGGPAPALEVGRVETADDGRYLRIYDRAGSLVVQQSVDTSGTKETYYPVSPITSSGGGGAAAAVAG